MRSVRYIGRYRAVVVEVAPQRWQTVHKREVIEVADRIADGLLDQSDSWAEVKSTSKSTRSSSSSTSKSKAPPADTATEPAAEHQEG
jgi:hypothetical protein